MVTGRRPIVIPAVNAFEEIRMIEEVSPLAGASGYVRVSVATVDVNGAIVSPMFKSYMIEKGDYAKLTGPVTPDLPGKPVGTYRNEDLWYFIDQQRSKGRV